MPDHEAAYRQAERQLREMLFGDGETSIGVVRGEDAKRIVAFIAKYSGPGAPEPGGG